MMKTAAMRIPRLCLVALTPVGLGAQDPVRAADMTLRGLKATDFPPCSVF